MTTTALNIEAALELAGLGYHIHALRSGSKAPATTNGSDDATTDTGSIRSQFRPGSNIGIALKASGLFVVGPDCAEWLATFEQRGLPDTMTAESGSGPEHRHYYYRLPDGAPIHRYCVADEFDIISNGYVIAPPSVTTGPYTWLTPLRAVSELPYAPAWAVEMLQAYKDKDDAKPSPASLPATPLVESDQEIIERARAAKNGAKFDRLYNGDLTAHSGTDHTLSGADLALLSMLTFWTQDENQLDRLFANSGLYRPDHWKGTYRTATLSTALKRTEFYEPGPTLTIPRGGSKNNGAVEPESDRADPIPFRTGLTDTGNAELFVEQYRYKIRHVPVSGLWHIYDGRRWAEDNKNEIDTLAKETALSLYRKASEESDYKKRADILKWGKSSESSRGRKAMTELATSEQEIVLLPTEFDSDTLLLNCQNGTLDLRSGELLDHDPDLLQSRITSVDYMPGTTSPHWETFLRDVTGEPEDGELRTYLQRSAGASLAGWSGDELVWFLYGSTSTGKTTFLEAIATALGDYARPVSIKSFLHSGQADRPRPDLVAMVGARLIYASEIDDPKSKKVDTALAVELIKRLASNEIFIIRDLYGRSFEWLPSCAFWFAANHEPEVDPLDTAMWRRIHRIPFDNQHRNPDSKIRDQLKHDEETQAAILAWLVKGWFDYQEHGIDTPESVVASTAAYRQSQDVAGRFVDEMYETGLEDIPEHVKTGSVVNLAFDSWCDEEGIDNPPKQDLISALESRGCYRKIDRIGDKTARVWRRIRLR